MKRYIRSDVMDIFGMANITPRRSGIPADIWSDHSGITRQVSHKNTPKAKISFVIT